MDEMNNNKVERMLYSISDFKDGMIKSVNYIRGDINELKGEIKDLKSDVNEVKSELIEFKEESYRRWDNNDKKWERYEKNRKEDRKYILDILTSYDISISTRLGAPNVEKMRKLV